MYLGADLAEAEWVPMWPPDAFAIGAALLRRTGGYVDLVNGPGSRSRLPVPRADEIVQWGQRWRQSLDELFLAASQGRSTGRLRSACPPAVRDAWRLLTDRSALPLADAGVDRQLTAAAVTLCTVADAACNDLGLGNGSDSGSGGSPFLAVAEEVAEMQRRRSYCMHIASAKVAVLGKQHTPQRGCSIRSLSHNLSLYTPSEIQAVWPAPLEKTTEDIDVFNLLLLPWPTEVKDGDFVLSSTSGVHRYFDYAPKRRRDAVGAEEAVRRALDQARRFVDRVHAVVLPELALDDREFEAVERLAASRRAILVSGVRKSSSAETRGLPANTCAIQPHGMTVASDARSPRVSAKALSASRRIQYKHHRWCLDRRQIMQYGLGGRLPASHDCWERAFIGPREINFVTIANWLTICALVCEDLARQEPVTEVLRAVGPNLIFALLMDGPQLRSRWSSRYASVLAEDPGCSVLSLTSLGMSRRSQSGDPASPDKSNTIALWRDAVHGEHEISLKPGHDACVLSLVKEQRQEFTIDGRGDSGAAQFPVFAGSLSFSSRPLRKPGRVKMKP